MGNKGSHPVISKGLLLGFLGIILLPSTLLSAQTMITGTEVVLAEGVIDLRENPQMRKRGADGPGSYYSMEDLQIGSVFIGADNIARKVITIYEDHGQTVIETAEPRIEEVLHSYTIPDQEIRFTRQNIDPQSLYPGVSLLSDTYMARSEMPSNGDWLETDPDWMGNDVITMDIDIPLWSGGSSGEGEADWGGQEVTGTLGDGIETGTANAGFNAGISGELRIEGILRIAEPVLRAGSKMPSISVTWVQVWWYFGYPEVTFEDGYLHASFDAAQQFDFKLIGSVSLETEIEIPLLVLIVTDPYNVAKFEVGVYLKIPIEGEIKVVFEISEYTDFNIWSTVDLFWPFIPYNLRAGGDHYTHFSLRPSIEAEVEERLGLYLGMSGSILGFDLLEAEVGGGIYHNTRGYMESRNVIGYSSDAGSYGSLFDSWNYEITMEVGGYVEASITIASILPIDIFEYKWPFWTWETSGTF